MLEINVTRRDQQEEVQHAHDLLEGTAFLDSDGDLGIRTSDGVVSFCVQTEEVEEEDEYGDYLTQVYERVEVFTFTDDELRLGVNNSHFDSCRVVNATINITIS